MWLTIGDASKRTGLPVKTIRYYADIGLVPSTERSPAGYRLYDAATIARLDLVRTLRDLDFDLGSIRALLEKSTSLPELAAHHAGALDAQIRILSARRSVLRAVAQLGIDSEEELMMMNRLARLSAEERQRILDEYFDETFEGLDIDPQFVAMSRSVRVDLPEDPSPAQVEAWIELAELVLDPEYRARVRQMARAAHDARSAGDTRAGSAASQQELFARVVAAVEPLRSAGVDPASGSVRAVVDELAAAFAAAGLVADDAGFRRKLADQITMFSDRRVERFWELVGLVNGWPQRPQSNAVVNMEWFAEALRASIT
nr:MerR family transcriptional regulator [Phytoactinopolyspora alkaliphila]